MDTSPWPRPGNSTGGVGGYITLAKADKHMEDVCMKRNFQFVKTCLSYTILQINFQHVCDPLQMGRFMFVYPIHFSPCTVFLSTALCCYPPPFPGLGRCLLPVRALQPFFLGGQAGGGVQVQESSWGRSQLRRPAVWLVKPPGESGARLFELRQSTLTLMQKGQKTMPKWRAGKPPTKTDMQL